MTDKELYRQIGRNIKAIRIKQGLTQLDLAASCSIEKSTVGRIEIGATNPTVKTLAKIARALDVSVLEFFRKTKDKK